MKTSIKIAAALLAVAAVPAAQASVTFAERDALFSIYNATGGDGWTHKMNWLGAPGTECAWDGVVCEDDKIVELDLANNGLVGELPAEIGELKNLQVLNLASNKLSGPLPKELWRLPLTRVVVVKNEFSGALPAEAAVARGTLEFLSLTHNKFTGSVPESWGELTKLKMLAVGYNELSGELPESLKNLRELQQFRFPKNDISGPVPAWLVEMPKLLKIWLNDNAKITGDIPAILGDLDKLREIRVHNTSVTGGRPDSFREAVVVKLYHLTKRWPSMYFGTTPDEDLGLWVNNIGVYVGETSELFTCVAVATNGSKAERFDAVLVLDGDVLTLGRTRPFNARGARNEIGALPDCSGVYETTTGVLTDTIFGFGRTYAVTFEPSVTAETGETVLKLSKVEQLVAK